MTRPNFNIRPEDLPYRPCVGVMLMNAEGLVFVGRRIDQTGENPRTAALRELKEEIGTNRADVLCEMDEWLTYDLPPHLVGVALKGRYRGQRQKWQAMRFTGKDKDIDVNTDEPEFAEWKWLAMEALPRMIVPFKRDTYARVIEAFRDLAFPGS